MTTLPLRLYVLALLGSAALVRGHSSIINDLTVTEASRSIDLTGGQARVELTMTLRTSSAQSYALLAFSAKHTVAHISVAAAGGAPLRTVATSVMGAPARLQFYRVNFASPLAAGAALQLRAAAVLVGALAPLPASTKQGVPQRLVYIDEHFLPSPYKVESQRTDVLLPTSGAPEGWAAAAAAHPAAALGSAAKTVRYGGYGKQPPYAISPMRLHFEQPAPLWEVGTLTRELR